MIFLSAIVVACSGTTHEELSSPQNSALDALGPSVTAEENIDGQEAERGTRQVAVLSGETCDEHEDFLRCERWPNLLLRPPHETGSSRIVLVDRGGPGIDNLLGARYFGEIVPMDLVDVWLAVLVEAWNINPVTQECSETIDEHVSLVRRLEFAEAEKRASLVLEDCDLSVLSTEPQAIVAQLQDLVDVVDAERVGAVAASFGASRIAQIDAAGADFDAVLVDSPFYAPSGDSTGRLGKSVRRSAEGLVAGPWPLPRILEEQPFAEVDYSVPFVESDLHLALYAASLTPEVNEQWARRVYRAEDLTTDDTASIRGLADAVLRHDGFDRYSDSWAGHLADYCRYISYEPGIRTANPQPAVFSFVAYFDALYSPCGVGDILLPEILPQGANSPLFGCVVFRDRDPVANAVPSEWARSMLRIPGQAGHVPFSDSPELTSLLDDFWEACAS